MSRYLDEELLVGRGNERLCYICPDDKSKVIKITYKKKRNQNALEYKYYEYLKGRGVPFTHIVQCYGWKNIDNRKGLVFERVLNFDSTDAVTFDRAVRIGLVTPEYAAELLEELREYLEENRILFVDVGLDNIMCKKTDSKKFSLVIVDGLGARREGPKFWMYLHIPLYAAYKVKSQWKKVMQNFDKLLKSVV